MVDKSFKIKTLEAMLNARLKKLSDDIPVDIRVLNGNLEVDGLIIPNDIVWVDFYMNDERFCGFKFMIDESFQNITDDKIKHYANYTVKISEWNNNEDTKRFVSPRNN